MTKFLILLFLPLFASSQLIPFEFFAASSISLPSEKLEGDYEVYINKRFEEGNRRVFKGRWSGDGKERFVRINDIEDGTWNDISFHDTVIDLATESSPYSGITLYPNSTVGDSSGVLLGVFNGYYPEGVNVDLTGSGAIVDIIMDFRISQNNDTVDGFRVINIGTGSSVISGTTNYRNPAYSVGDWHTTDTIRIQIGTSGRIRLLPLEGTDSSPDGNLQGDSIEFKNFKLRVIQSDVYAKEWYSINSDTLIQESTAAQPVLIGDDIEFYKGYMIRDSIPVTTFEKTIFVVYRDTTAPTNNDNDRILNLTDDANTFRLGYGNPYTTGKIGVTLDAEISTTIDYADLNSALLMIDCYNDSIKIWQNDTLGLTYNYTASTPSREYLRYGSSLGLKALIISRNGIASDEDKEVLKKYLRDEFNLPE